MTEIVMGYALHTDLRRPTRHAVLAFKDAHHGCARRFIRSLGSQFLQHPLKFWNHRHVSHLAVLCCSLRVASHMQLGTAKVCVCPRHIFCFADSQAAVSEKPHEIRAVLRLSCARVANLLNEFQEFFARWKLQFFLTKFYAREFRRRIIESCTGADRFIENRSQRPDAVVHHSRCVLLLKSREPILTIALAYFSHIGFEQQRPRALDEIQRHLTVVFRARLERRVCSDLSTMYFYRVANCHLAASERFYGFVARAVIADFVWQPLFRDRENCRLKTLTDQLSADSETSEVRSRSSVADQVLNRCAFPKRFFRIGHGAAIRHAPKEPRLGLLNGRSKRAKTRVSKRKARQ